MLSTDYIGIVKMDIETNDKKEFLGTMNIPIDDLYAPPQTANVMDDGLLEKLKAHIKQSKRYPFLIVRPHPDRQGKYQMLDGHHRIQVLKDLNYETARCDVWDVSNKEAKVLLATLNRLEGQDQPLRRAQLVHDLLADISMSDLAGLLPENDKQIEELNSLLQFPAEEIAMQLEEETKQAEKVMPMVIHFVVTPDQEDVISQAVELASDGTVGRDRKAKGLYNLAVKFLEDRSEERNNESSAQ